MSNEAVDVLVIGAGVSGLATAGRIARSGRSVGVVEQHRRAGMETSTHNSGVIHAGLYYSAGTLKTQLCIEGRHMLYEFCAKHQVPHDRCGKLVVATTEEEVGELERLRQYGTTNGVEGLEVVDEAFVRGREPRIRGVAALWSPNSGRVEAESLVRALQRVAEADGAIVLRDAKVVGGESRADGSFEVRLQREVIDARVVVNAAGLFADDVSAAFGGETFTIYPVRGEYAELKPSRRAWVNGLVYPLPHAKGHGLGTHFTKTIGGSVLLGPTVRYQDRKDDYEDDRLPLESFAESARVLMPEATIDDLTYGGSGIRPKLHPASERFADFMIRPDARVPTLIHAAGIESPGLTACLALAERVGQFVDEILA
jgi:L-2-hydroxyglutarate oxidase LhgO